MLEQCGQVSSTVVESTLCTADRNSNAQCSLPGNCCDAVAKALEQLDMSVKEATAAKQRSERLEGELSQTQLALQQAHAETAR